MKRVERRSKATRLGAVIGPKSLQPSRAIRSGWTRGTTPPYYVRSPCRHRGLEHGCFQLVALVSVLSGEMSIREGKKEITMDKHGQHKVVQTCSGVANDLLCVQKTNQNSQETRGLGIVNPNLLSAADAYVRRLETSWGTLREHRWRTDSGGVSPPALSRTCGPRDSQGAHSGPLGARPSDIGRMCPGASSPSADDLPRLRQDVVDGGMQLYRGMDGCRVDALVSEIAIGLCTVDDDGPWKPAAGAETPDNLINVHDW